MAWTLPRTYVAGEIITASILNTYVRDDFRYLHGDDGTTTLAAGLTLGAFALTINALETVGADGIVNKEQVEDHTHVDTANCGTVAHSALTGLTAGDDHTQYQKESLLTTEGDIPYATADSTWARKAIGTAGQVFRVNAGATAPEWAASIATKEFYIPVTYSGGTWTTAPMGALLDADTETGYCSFAVPDDFVSITEAVFIVSPSSTQAAANWDIAATYGTIGQAYNTHAESDTATTYNVTNGQFFEVNVATILTALAVADIVSIGITCKNASHPLIAMGVRLKYV